MRTALAIGTALLLSAFFGRPALAAPGWEERVGPLWQERLQRIVENGDFDAADGDPLKQAERWFSRQKSMDGGYCCSKADAYPFNGDYQLTAEGGVKFEWRDQDGSQFTVIVPPEKMLDQMPNDPNLTGGAVIWYSGVLNAGINPNLHCFALGKLG